MHRGAPQGRDPVAVGSDEAPTSYKKGMINAKWSLHDVLATYRLARGRDIDATWVEARRRPGVKRRAARAVFILKMGELPWRTKELEVMSKTGDASLPFSTHAGMMRAHETIVLRHLANVGSERYPLLRRQSGPVHKREAGLYLRCGPWQPGRHVRGCQKAPTRQERRYLGQIAHRVAAIVGKKPAENRSWRCCLYDRDENLSRS